MTIRSRACTASLIVATLWAVPAAAQEIADVQDARPPRRTRVMLGPQLAPRYPGADSGSVFPLINVDRTREDAFLFEAPDESGGFYALRRGGFAFGPAFNLQGSRRVRDTDGRLPRVGFTVELGAMVQYYAVPEVRLRAEARRGIGGHKAWIGLLSADYVMRDADRWLISVGPRLTLSDRRFNRAYFGVAQADAATAGLPAYDPRAGVQAVGAAAEAIRSLGGRWGVFGYAKYDRLVDDAGASPVVRSFGSRNQLSGGVALSYTFGR